MTYFIIKYSTDNSNEEEKEILIPREDIINTLVLAESKNINIFDLLREGIQFKGYSNMNNQELLDAVYGLLFIENPKDECLYIDAITLKRAGAIAHNRVDELRKAPYTKIIIKEEE